MDLAVSSPKRPRRRGTSTVAKVVALALLVYWGFRALRGRGEAQRTAQPELPSLSQAAGPNSPRGNLAKMRVARDDALLASSNISRSKYGRVPRSATIGVYYPKMFTDDRTWPLFLAMHPGVGNGVVAINAYRRFADTLGFIVAAPDIPAEADIEEARYYYCLHIIHLLRDTGHIGEQPVWIGGFSGGAKWAMHLGAYAGDIFSGILAIGANQDFATLGYKEMGNNTALTVPIYLLNGTRDKVAGTGVQWYKPMIDSIEATGFTTLEVAAYDGGHYVPYQGTVRAFQWLQGMAR